jgi:lipid-A-disaccharide synthase
MKKIFILTGEPSGDKLAAKVISKLKIKDPSITYLCLGGEELKSLGINSISKLSEVTYLGFTRVLLNLFTIKRKINETSRKILEFKPDILFSVDSPDFTLRVAEKVKNNSPNIKTIHFVAPQVWVWREGRVKKIKKFIDHILLLFKFEKKYWEKENVSCEFVGHPLLENNKEDKIELNQVIKKNKAIISVFPGSRDSEVKKLTPILLDFIKLMNEKYEDFLYVFHSTKAQRSNLENIINKSQINNIEIISDDKIKDHILKKSIFAVSKSGTVSLQICNFNVPSIIIYKLSFINFMIFKMLVNVKFANIINIINNREIIPELLQKECNADEIYRSVIYFLKNPELMKKQVSECSKTLEGIRSKTSSAGEASSILIKYLS